MALEGKFVDTTGVNSEVLSSFLACLTFVIVSLEEHPPDGWSSLVREFVRRFREGYGEHLRQGQSLDQREIATLEQVCEHFLAILDIQTQ